MSERLGVGRGIIVALPLSIFLWVLIVWAVQSML